MLPQLKHLKAKKAKQGALETKGRCVIKLVTYKWEGGGSVSLCVCLSCLPVSASLSLPVSVSFKQQVLEL